MLRATIPNALPISGFDLERLCTWLEQPDIGPWTAPVRGRQPHRAMAHGEVSHLRNRRPFLRTNPREAQSQVLHT
jgi:hypothetical protein